MADQGEMSMYRPGLLFFQRFRAECSQIAVEINILKSKQLNLLNIESGHMMSDVGCNFLMLGVSNTHK